MKKILILGLFLVPSVVFASIDINLKYGARGTEVTELQEFLIDKGFLSGQATGNFFSLTLRAVKAFQVANGLPSTGYFGPMSRAKANQLLTEDISTTNSAEITETGTTTQPTNTNQLAILNQQIAELNKKLEEQKQIQQQTQNTLQQTQQSVQQIQQNTTPVPYVPPQIIQPVITWDNKIYKTPVYVNHVISHVSTQVQIGYLLDGKKKFFGPDGNIKAEVNGQVLTSENGSIRPYSSMYPYNWFTFESRENGTYPVKITIEGNTTTENVLIDEF